MAYNRAAAVAYARQYCDKVCHDGKVATKSGYPSQINNVTLTPGLPFKEIGPMPNDDDCTHFISCCVGQGPGGGLSIKSPFGVDHAPDQPDLKVYGETYAPRLVGALIIRGAKFIMGSLAGARQFMVNSNDATKAAIQNLSGGDVVAYAEVTNLERDGTGKYKHMAILLDSDGKIACHTKSRCGTVDYTDVYYPWITLLKMP
jgi:hypothetical protein